MIEKKDKDLMNLSQSLDDNQTKIDETHKLIFEIEEQLKAITQKPMICKEPNYVSPSKQDSQVYSNQTGDFQSPPQITNHIQHHQRSSQSNEFHPQQQQLEQMNQKLHSPQQFNSYNPQHEINHNQSDFIQNHGNITGWNKRNNSYVSPERGSYQHRVEREVGKIRNQAWQGGYQPKSTGNEIGGELREMQREHLSDIAMLEQEYRKKLIEMEEMLAFSREKYEKQAQDTQRVLDLMQEKEMAFEEFRRRQEDELNELKNEVRQEALSEVAIYVKRLEITDREKRDLQEQNTVLQRQCNLLKGQNEIVSNKYSRMLSLYNQLIDADRFKLSQLTQASTNILNRHNEHTSQFTDLQRLSSPNQQLEILDEIHQQRKTAEFDFLPLKSYPKSSYLLSPLPKYNDSSTSNLPFRELQNISEVQQPSQNLNPSYNRSIEPTVPSQKQEDQQATIKQQSQSSIYQDQNTLSKPQEGKTKTKTFVKKVDKLAVLKKSVENIKSTLDDNLKVQIDQINNGNPNQFNVLDVTGSVISKRSNKSSTVPSNPSKTSIPLIPETKSNKKIYKSLKKPLK